MPIGFLIGLSIALLIHGAAVVIANSPDKNRPSTPLEARLLRTKFLFAGQTMFYIGLLTLVGTFFELIVR